jgi:hypothetical protein
MKNSLFLVRLVQRWQECYSGCDLRDLFNDRIDLKELLKNHPNPEVRPFQIPSFLYFLSKNCENLVNEVKKEYDLEGTVTANNLREVSGKRD